jgi:HSP20 family protein
LDFWDLEKYDNDGEDFVWLDISFERKRTFLTNIFWHTTDIIGDNLLRELDDRELEMEQKIFDQQFKDIIYSSNSNKLVRRYKKAKNSKSKKVHYDYSTNVVEADNKSKMKELDDNIIGHSRNIMAKSEDPLVDIIRSEKEVRIVIEMPLVTKKDILINAYEDRVEVHVTKVQGGKYHHVIDIPSDLDIGSAKSTYRNGILEIVFCKRRSFKIEVR